MSTTDPLLSFSSPIWEAECGRLTLDMRGQSQLAAAGPLDERVQNADVSLLINCSRNQYS